MLICLMLSGCFGPAKVKVETVGEKDMPISLSADANVAALNKATVLPSISASVLDMKVKVGDEVQAGQVLAVLDGASLQAQLSTLYDQLAQAQASASSAPAGSGSGVLASGNSGDAERARQLLAQGIITQKEYNAILARSGGSSMVIVRGGGGASSSGGYAADTSGIEAAIAQVKQQMAQTQIVAPIAGRVSAIYNEDKKIAIAGRPFMMIQQMSPVVASLSIPQSFAAQLATPEVRSATQVSLTVGGKALPGELTYVDTASPAGTPGVLVKATFDNADGAITPGDFYPLGISSPARANVTAIPKTAVHSNDDGKFVYILTKENTVDVRLVDVGSEENGYVAVLHGLADGETLITTDGKFDLGEKVQPES